MNLITVFAISVLSIGIISCSSDKSKNEPFTVKGLQTKNLDRTYALLKESDFINIDSEIVIGSLEDQDLRKHSVALKMIATCTNYSDGRRSNKESYWLNTASLKVINLVPVEILTANTDEIVSCDFILQATNANNSTHTSEMNDIQIKNISRINNLTWSPPSSPLVISATEELQLPAAASGAIWTLACGKFSKSLEHENNLTLQHFFAGNSSFASGLQTCRLIKAEQKNVFVSSPVSIIVPVKELQVTTELINPEGISGRIENLHVARLSLTNPNSFPMTIHLDTLSKFTYCYSILFLPNHLSSVNCRPVTFLVEGKILTPSNASGGVSLEILPQQRLELNGHIRVGISCTSIYGIPQLHNIYAPVSGLLFDMKFGTDSKSTVSGTTQSYPLNFKVSNQIPRLLPINQGLTYWYLQPERAKSQSKHALKNKFGFEGVDPYVWLSSTPELLNATALNLHCVNIP